ncbi:MAG TPA: TRAM domain-containing protein [Methanothermococcus okinawensis]|uniref:TRAM domain-containing protein n=1 Tax=Methanothermococcus okinawensis TaxID=155863 RepID=A0A832ZIL9_9EURY|nr:TRAM domain-containing protein [Methanococcaceae archaeon]HIP84857.1 TRAM domain-containing protein [Methanothermococcus okinawensis]HIP90689.1 TRAM domain-containing protein [Methanothermococcus okinawensis]
MSFNRQNNNSRKIPVVEGEEYTVTIEDIGRGGDGIARVEGFVIFVPNTTKGETVTVKITAVKDRFAFGEKI